MTRGAARGRSRGARTINLITGKPAAVPRVSVSNIGLDGGARARFPKKATGAPRPQRRPRSAKADRQVSNSKQSTGNTPPGGSQ